MTTFTAWKFEDPDGAEKAAGILKRAERDRLITVIDHAVVSWPVGASRPKTDQGHEDKKRGAGWGAFWGLLVGTLFLVPVLGGVAGAAIGAVAKATEKLGIDEAQLEKIRSEVTEGTSALFAVTEEADFDRVAERFHGMHSKLVGTNLTEEERKILLETFGGD